MRNGCWRASAPPSRDPVEILGPVFTSMAEAEWHVFKLRWKQFSGEDLPLG